MLSCINLKDNGRGILVSDSDTPILDICTSLSEIFQRGVTHPTCTGNLKSVANRALEKVDKKQLNRKRFEIYQTISCFWAFLQTLSLNNITKLASMSIKPSYPL